MKYALIICLIALITLSACTTKSPVPAEGDSTTKTQEPIKIGFIGPLTSEVSAIGISTKNAAQLAVDEENVKGGQQFKLLIEDGACSGKAANDAANKLMNVDHVFAIIGGLCSGESLSFAELAENNRIPMVSPASSAPALSESGDYVFRLVPSDSYQAKVAAELARDKFEANTVAVLYSNDEWASGLATAFQERFKELGGTILLVESFEKSSNDFRTQLTKIEAAKPDIVYMPAYYQDAARALLQANELDMNVQFIGADGSKDDTLISIGGTAVEGFIFTIPSSKNSPEFDAAYQQAYNEAPKIYAQHTYDTAKILMQIIEEQGTNAEAVKNALYKVDYEGASGHITFDSNGDLANPSYDIIIVKDGAFVPFNVTE